MKTISNQLCQEPGRMRARSHSKYQGPEGEKSLVGSRDGEKKLVGLYHRKRGRLHMVRREGGGQPDGQVANRPALAGRRQHMVLIFHISIFQRVRTRVATEIYKILQVNLGFTCRKSEISSEMKAGVADDETQTNTGMRGVSPSTQYKQIILGCNLGDIITSSSRKVSKDQH